MEPTNWTISKLVQKFLDKEIQLPEMQRKYVWKQEKVRALVDSIYKGYPSGSILLWETDKLPEIRSAAVEKDTQHNLDTTLLLLDGQQRLTSLAAVLTGLPVKVKIGSSVKEKSIEVYFNMNHPDNFQDYDTIDDYEKSLDDYTDEDLAVIQKQENPLEHPILKTLTAFMNTDGGTLFVGVDKDGNILGIEKDFETLGDKNWDGWSQAFTNIVNSRIGKEFHKYIKPEPLSVNGKTIVKIDVKKGSNEAYIDPDSKAEFHIRAGTTTQMLNPKQTSAYVRDHFYNQ